jgi:hypothetical protein
MSKCYDDLWDEHYDSIYGKLGLVADFDVKFTTKDGKEHKKTITGKGEGFYDAMNDVKSKIANQYEVVGDILAKREGNHWINNDWK